ncbi:hypothetical protein FNQ90_23850 [Streptomyces alkaliphilus]|uniref:Uncharacterized protein n=1 Tax=Streptomyces alkaliphilus TaxID=1472722 RepID=A0A7W3Y3Q0_9ACTN|nr:hypothetical protein [Streptomyces alkaliphilus]MBB0247074.1 hypothetical protein [Streptomyces alkaliphilus]
MRVYLPLTLPGLAEAYRAGEVGPAPLAARAVTPGLREWYLSGTEEELEYAALGRAALDSLRLIAADRDVPPRRVVLAVDVPDDLVRTDPDRALLTEALGEVTLTEAVPVARWAAAHVDSADAETDLVAAADALPAAEKGDPDARFVLEGTGDHELLWYAVQEIPALDS